MKSGILIFELVGFFLLRSGRRKRKHDDEDEEQDDMDEAMDEGPLISFIQSQSGEVNIIFIDQTLYTAPTRSSCAARR